MECTGQSGTVTVNESPHTPAILALFGAWNAFYAKHRPILTSVASVHLARPTSRSVEATAHLDASPGAAERCLLSLFNPTQSALSGKVALPLYYAGLAPGQVVSVLSAGAPAGQPAWLLNATVGADPEGAIYEVMVPYALAARSYALFLVTNA